MLQGKSRKSCLTAGGKAEKVCCRREKWRKSRYLLLLLGKQEEKYCFCKEKSRKSTVAAGKKGGKVLLPQ